MEEDDENIIYNSVNSHRNGTLYGGVSIVGTNT